MAATDTFSTLTYGLDSPAQHAAAVTPNDGTDLANATRAVYVGGAGSVKVDLVGGETAVTFTAVPVGTVLPLRATRVYSTGTTATALVAMW